MSIFERIGVTLLTLLLAAWIGLGLYVQYDYWYNVRSKLTEVVMTTSDGKKITRIEMYDAVSAAVINQMKETK